MIAAGFSNTGAYKGGHDTYVADLLGFFLPNSRHWLGHVRPIHALTGMFTGFRWESAVYLGLSLLIIILATVRFTIAESSRYILGLLACLVLSLGERLHTLGWSAPVLLPYSVLAHIPFLANMRAPSRHMVYAFLFLGILVAIGLRHLCRSHVWSSRARICFAALAVLIVIDYYSFDKEMTPVNFPPAYQAIVNNGDGALVDMPIDVFKRLSYPMLYQTFHRRPIVNAPLARKLEPSLIDSLNINNVDLQLRQLADDDVRFIVVHKAFLDSDSTLDTLAYDRRCRRLFADADQIVYVVP